MPWDDVNVARLRELWDQGLPTAQIGKLIGFTKNAVVGKAHRIGLKEGLLQLEEQLLNLIEKKLVLQ